MTEYGFKLFMKQLEFELLNYFIAHYDPDREYKHYYDSYEVLGIDEDDIDFIDDLILPFYDNLNDQIVDLSNIIYSNTNNNPEEFRLTKHYITKNNNIVVNIRYTLPFI